MPRLLLCPPEYYGIEYEINAWMDRARGAIPELARAQWQSLHDQLRSLGCEIHLLNPRHGLPDLVFTANGGLAAGRKFYCSNFRFPERRGEEICFQDWFAGQNYEVIRLPEGMYFEGEGDALFCGDVLFCGYRFRSDIRSHRWLAESMKTLVVSVELVQERFYHLDTCFCPLPGDAAVWYPPAFDEYAQRAIRHHVRELIEVESEEALRFGCNAVVFGQNVILPDGCPKLSAALVNRGFHPHPISMTEFLKAGGACKCLTLQIPQR